MKPELLTGYYQEGNDADGTPYRYQSLDDYIGLSGVDWQGETFNPTWSQDHNFSLMGGSDNTKYNASFSRYIENGISRTVVSTRQQQNSVSTRKSTKRFHST